MEKKKEKLSFKNLKLAAKTSIGVAAVLVVLLTMLVVTAIWGTSNVLIRTINSELTNVATQNGIMVQNILGNASATAKDLQSYLENAFAENEQIVKNPPRDAEGKITRFETKRSRIYSAYLMEHNYEVETYMLNTMWSAVGNDDDIVGIGVFFEPNAFDTAKKDYTVYVGNDDAKNRSAQSYGEYSYYGSQDYYTEAANSKKSVFTDPYQDQGVTMITASYPVICNGAVKGVIVVDINVDNFSKLHITDEKYPTLSSSIYSDAGTFIYDSETSDNIGRNLGDLIGAEDFDRVDRMSQSYQSFNIDVTVDKTPMKLFFYPIQAEGTYWWSSTALEKADMMEEVVRLAWLMVIGSVLVTAAIILFSSFFVKRMLRPIDGIVSAAHEIANGNLSVDLKIDSRDEIGNLADSFSEMCNTACYNRRCKISYERAFKRQLPREIRYSRQICRRI